MKVPFTPGLIPKEKNRIARSIGNTIGDYLLSTETIINTLKKRDIEEKIRGKVHRKFLSLRKENRSLDYFLKEFLKEDYVPYKKGLRNLLKGGIVERIRREETKEEIHNFLQTNIDQLLQGRGRDFLEENLNKRLGQLYLDQRSFGELIPQEVRSTIYSYIEKNEEEIGDFVRARFKEEEFQNKLKLSIGDAVDKNVSRLITSFIEPSLIADKVFTIIERYIYSENTARYMVEFTKDSLTSFLDLKVMDIAPGLLEGIEEDKKDRIIKKGLDHLFSQENHELLRSLVGNSLNDFIQAESLEATLDHLVDRVIKEVVERPLGFYLGQIQEDQIEKLYLLIKKQIDEFLIDHLARVIELFNISKIVEEEIQGFDVEFTEKLILDIADKELKAITRLGALLGAIMGLLTPFLQLLY